MRNFRDKIAVITGAGTGMGRELAIQLISEGCNLAICDILTDNLEETQVLCRDVATFGARVTIHTCDVAVESQVVAFCDEVKDAHRTQCVNLLFNNAGIGGGHSFLLDERSVWDRTFAVNWFGVYYCSRAFMPMLTASDEGHLINTSSVNGFWANLGPSMPYTAYSAAKFAIKGFSEALLVDLRLNAPHVKVTLVMPGHIGTSIAVNAAKIHGTPSPEEMTSEQLSALRARMIKSEKIDGQVTNEELRNMMIVRQNSFRDDAPMSATQAATCILDAVRKGVWRVLVGKDAVFLDKFVRENPQDAYDPAFFSEVERGVGSEMFQT